MSKPVMQANGGSYTLQWADEQVHVTVDRIRENSSSGNTSGEITISHDLVGGHIHQARLGLTDTRARSSLVRQLNERVPGVDWYAIIEATCANILDHYRTGEPPVSLDIVGQREANEYRLYPFLLDNRASMLFSAGGVGKSTLATMFAVMIQGGVNVLGMTTEPGQVLYCDYESDEYDLRDRAAAICQGLGIEYTVPILYRYCHRPIADDIIELEHIVSEYNVQYIIIDSAGPACGGEPENADATINYFTKLRSLKIGSLTIAHTSKNGDDRKPFGSAFWENYSRTMWQVQKSQELGEDKLDVALFHRKVNNGKYLPPVGFSLAYGDGIINLSKVAVKDNPEFVKTMPNRERMHQALEQGAMTVQELHDELNIAIDTVRATLNRKPSPFVHIQQGADAGKWGIATPVWVTEPGGPTILPTAEGAESDESPLGSSSAVGNDSAGDSAGSTRPSGGPRESAEVPSQNDPATSHTQRLIQSFDVPSYSKEETRHGE